MRMLKRNNIVKLVLFGCDVVINGDDISIDMEKLGNMEKSNVEILRDKILCYLVDEGILEECEKQI